MFIFDPLIQGLEALAQRELEGAERLFLQVINDSYAQDDELSLARKYLEEIRSCQAGNMSLDFDKYKRAAKKTVVLLDNVNELLSSIYFSKKTGFSEIEAEIQSVLPKAINRLKRVKICDIVSRDKLFATLEKQALKIIKQRLGSMKGKTEKAPALDIFRWKTIYRKFLQQVNPILLECHFEMLEYILASGDIGLLDDPKLTILTPKYRWIIESTLKSKWYLLRSYFFKAKTEVQEQFFKKEGTRKYWEEVKYKKIQIFEECGFHEKHIQKFLFIDKLNYKTLEEIHRFAKSLDLSLMPRDVSLALRGVEKSKDHIKERGGTLFGNRRVFQDELLALGFDRDASFKIARQAKKANNHQIAASFKLSLQAAREEIFWYRASPDSDKLWKDLQAQCYKHLSTVRIHLFERGRLNKLLLQIGKSLIRKYLIKIYGEGVVDLHCYFRLETVHQYYKLKFFENHSKKIPSVSELIKISRKEFKPVLLEGYHAFLKKRRLTIPASLLQATAKDKSLTQWEDVYTTPEEKLLLKFWFLMDHGASVTQGMINKGWLNPKSDLWGYVRSQGPLVECKI